jgi:hypothetical protein
VKESRWRTIASYGWVMERLTIVRDRRLTFAASRLPARLSGRVVRHHEEVRRLCLARFGQHHADRDGRIWSLVESLGQCLLDSVAVCRRARRTLELSGACIKNQDAIGLARG